MERVSPHCQMGKCVTHIWDLGPGFRSPHAPASIGLVTPAPSTIPRRHSQTVTDRHGDTLD